MLQNAVMAQDSKDKVADVLAHMPAFTAAALKNDVVKINALGEDGLVRLISGLGAPGAANNAAIEYTIGAFTAAATQTGNEAMRKLAVSAYIKGLQKLTDRQAKQFIIAQFDLVGKDDAVATLKTYLTDNDLADAASRALVKINSPASKAALLSALPQASGAAKLSVIEALGNSRYKAAAKAINALAVTNDAALAKVSYYALAYIADPSSEKVLAAAAAKSGYKYENTEAAKYYLIYAGQLAINGNKLLAQKIANSLLVKAKADDLVNVRISALKILVNSTPANQQLLLTAAGDANPQYRAAALRFALPYITPVTTKARINKLNTVNDDAKADILFMLGQTKAKTALPAIIALAKNKNDKVKLAAINAAVNIGQEQVLGSLIKLMDNGTSDDKDMIAEVIGHMKGATVTQQLADAIPTVKPTTR
ncbi:HEAT repeat domain-containing protein [Mucilaginibacter sp. S1162]|uniref:HEAT repeat domain-containing protein n=1 Tax=Mucilaginibacter humi TaxID=2732510 RepID=A0ABX1W3T8_9SPHI|nr:HEAT repeat domain-containing protein [Mucilaginibacter humi]NNU33650.1 HEAT repeat domain-containing protein [Mucilaginibacter humi]